MCHHYRNDLTPEELAEVFELIRNFDNHEQTRSADLFPLSSGAVIRLDEQGERELVSLQWGLLPAWWKPAAKSASRKAFQRQCFNARSETVHEKPTFAAAFRNRRCLIPATSFEEKGSWFSLPDSQPLVFAGLWERWNSPENAEVIESYTILTTTPNREVALSGHHRMPVILGDSDACRYWLSPDHVNHQELNWLMQPYQKELKISRPEVVVRVDPVRRLFLQNPE